MQSIGGYFLGTFSHDPDTLVMRKSPYYGSERDAERALDAMKAEDREPIACDGCDMPESELEYIEDEDSFYCPCCGTRTPAEQCEDEDDDLNAEYSVGHDAARWLSDHAANEDERRAVQRLTDFVGSTEDVELAATIYDRDPGKKHAAAGLRGMIEPASNPRD
jgi:hypothetical protein